MRGCGIAFRRHDERFYHPVVSFGCSLLQWVLMALDSPLVHAPDLQSGIWINAPSRPAWQDSDAGALIVSFSDFTCINCLRTFPYLRAWHRMYAPHLFLITVHTPEFSFAHDPHWVTRSSRRLGIRWPILMDNQQIQWTAWAVKAWPTLFIVDRSGFIRLTHAGDHGYASAESALRILLRNALSELTLPEPLGSLRPEDEPGAVCVPTTPELQADEVNQFVSTQGLNPFRESATPDGYRLVGDWARNADGWQLMQAPGAINLTYHAAEVHALLAPASETSLVDADHPGDPIVHLEFDGRPPTGGMLGTDVFQTSSGAGLRLDITRLYNLIKDSEVDQHELRLSFARPGPTFYAFSFGSCLTPPIDPSSS